MDIIRFERKHDLEELWAFFHFFCSKPLKSSKICIHAPTPYVCFIIHLWRFISFLGHGVHWQVWYIMKIMDFIVGLKLPCTVNSLLLDNYYDWIWIPAQESSCYRHCFAVCYWGFCISCAVVMRNDLRKPQQCKFLDRRCHMCLNGSLPQCPGFSFPNEKNKFDPLFKMPPPSTLHMRLCNIKIKHWAGLLYLQCINN